MAFSIYIWLTRHSAKLNVSRLILGCRDVAKGQRAQSEIESVKPHNSDISIEVWPIDLANYASVLAFNRRMQALERLDGFIANAGLEVKEFELAEGLEKSLTVNVVATYLNVLGALLKLHQTSTNFKVQPNLSIVGSMNRTYAPDVELDVSQEVDTFEHLSDKDTATMEMRYPLSKLIVHQIFRELGPIVSRVNEKASSIVVLNLVNPGWCYTELGRSKQEVLPERMIKSIIGRTAEQGSRTLVHGVTAGPETHGQYVSECQVKPETSYICSERGRRIQKKLWADLIRRLRIASAETAAYVD